MIGKTDTDPSRNCERTEWNDREGDQCDNQTDVVVIVERNAQGDGHAQGHDKSPKDQVLGVQQAADMSGSSRATRVLRWSGPSTLVAGTSLIIQPARSSGKARVP